MEKGQEQFYNYMLNVTDIINQDKMKGLLMESFNAQNNKTFSEDMLNNKQKEMLALVKDEFKDEVSEIFTQFKTQHVSK